MGLGMLVEGVFAVGEWVPVVPVGGWLLFGVWDAGGAEAGGVGIGDNLVAL